MELLHVQECTSKCQSWQHAAQLIAAITKGSVPQIQTFFECFCKNYTNIVDEFGRSVLHVAVSCGKWQLVKWLLEQGQMDCNVKDLESGYTPLHRSLFYGHVSSALVLLKHGAIIQVYDNEGLSPLDLIMKDKLSSMSLETGPGEVYTWGENINYNLGHSSQQTRKYPEILDIFRKKNISMKQVLLSKFHSVFLSHSGHVYTCGHGLGGRLGHPSEEACLTPRQVAFSYKCIQVAVGADHTVLLAENRTVWTCGLNTYCQLGHVPPPSKLATPKLITAKVLKNLNIKGICAGNFHTVIYTSDKLFTFGLNAGQLGHPKDIKLQILPGEVCTFNIKNFRIHHVTVSQGVTVCISTEGHVIVLHEYQCRTITKLEEIRKVVAYGGYLDVNRCGDKIKSNESCEPIILILTEFGKLFIWHGDSNVLRRCLFSMTRQLYGINIIINKNGVLCITKEGEGFMGEFVLSKCRRSAIEKGQSAKEKDCRLNSSDPHKVKLLNKEECVMINVQRLPFIHRGTEVTCDPNGKNFAVIQAHPSSNLTNLPITLASEFSQHLETLLRESDSTDNIHDVVIKAGNREFSAHKFILASRSDYFKKLFSGNESQGDTAPIFLMSDIQPDIFSQLLTFIYTNSCDLLTPGKKIVPSVTNLIQKDEIKHIYNEVTTVYQVIQQNNNNSRKDKQKKNCNIKDNESPFKLLRNAAKKLGVQDLITMLDAVRLDDDEVVQIKNNVDVPKLCFNRNSLCNLYDVCIRSSDGKELECHKCILAARLEYFHCMLTSGWIETSMCNALTLPIPASVLNIVLEYIYCDKAPSLIGRTDVEFLCNVLAITDQLLISRLRSMCEIALSNLITLKNAAALLDFAGIYKANQLKATCMQFICLNLAAILEMRTLDEVSEELIEDLTKTYRDMIPAMCCRIITPYSYGPNSKQLQCMLKEYPEYLKKQASVTSTIKETIKKTKIKRKSLSRRISLGDERNKDEDSQNGRHRHESICSVKSDITDPDSDVFLDQGLSQETISEMPIDDITNLEPGPDLSPVTLASSWPPRDARNVHIPWGRTLSVNCPPSPPIMDFRQLMQLENIEAKQSRISEGKKTSKVSQISNIAKQPNSISLISGHASGSEIEKNLKDGKKSPSPWTMGEASILNFRELLNKEEEKRHSQEAKTRSDQLICDRKNSPPKLFEPSSPPSNPWIKLGSSPQSAICSFTQIVKEEIKSKALELKLTNKPLTLIQLEEQAMQELLCHYQAFDNSEEYITIERLQPKIINSPIWKVQQTVRTTLGYKT